MLQGSLFSTGMCVLGQATNRCPSNDNKFWTNRTGMGKQSNLGHHCLQYHLQHFKDFLQGGLLCHGVVNGAALITRQGQLLYSHGDLIGISQDDIQQFQDLFGTTEKSGSAYSKEFCITSKSGVASLHTAYQKTYSSIYATSKGNNGGLTVCNLPYGLLVCVYPAEVNSGNAIKRIEAFCDLLRR